MNENSFAAIAKCAASPTKSKRPFPVELWQKPISGSSQRDRISHPDAAARAIAQYSTRIRLTLHSQQVMQTIAILPELSSDPPTYRAICGEHQVTGQTPGQALDQMEAELTAEPASGETLVILQRFRPDDLFTVTQQQRLRELMAQFQAAIAQGSQLDPTLQAELESLAEAELEANIQRSQRLLQHSNKTVQ